MKALTAIAISVSLTLGFTLFGLYIGKYIQEQVWMVAAMFVLTLFFGIVSAYCVIKAGAYEDALEIAERNLQLTRKNMLKYHHELSKLKNNDI